MFSKLARAAVIVLAIIVSRPSCGQSRVETTTKDPEDVVMAPAADIALYGFESAPKEIGTVAWTRNWDAAQKISSESGRPLFVLFQEVPG